MNNQLIIIILLFSCVFNHLYSMDSMESGIHYGAQTDTIEDLGQSIYYDAQEHEHLKVHGENPKPVIMIERYDLVNELKTTIKEKDEVIKKQEKTIVELQEKIKQLQHNNLRNTR